MVKGKSVDSRGAITKEDILSKVSSYDLYHFYCPRFKLGIAISSPLRVDRKPSFVIKQSKETGVTYHQDLARVGDPNHNGNALQFVGALFGINYDQALNKIATDFGIKGGERDFRQIISKYKQPEIVKGYKRLDIFTKPFTKEDLEYWSRFHITIEELKKFNIYSIDHFFSNGEKQYNPQNSPFFGYYYPQTDNWKLYAPIAEKIYKWKTNVPLTQIEGLETLRKDKICIGTKSRKDRICISKFISECFCTQNESIGSITSEDIQYIKDNSLKCYLFWDNDEVGVKACTYYNQFGFSYINIPKELGVKDPAEFIEKYGVKEFQNFLVTKLLN